MGDQALAPAAHYWVTEVLDVNDPVDFTNAVVAVSATVAKFNGKFVVFGGKSRQDIGTPPKRYSVVKFASRADVDAWANDPEVKKLRAEVDKHAKTRAFFLDGIPH